jgi:hypothetical protein
LHTLRPLSALSFKTKLRFVTEYAFALLVCGLCGCASQLATVKTIPARLTTGLRVEGELDSSTKYLLAAENEQPSAALGHDLVAAKIAYGVLARQPKNESACTIYNFTVARIVQDVGRTTGETARSVEQARRYAELTQFELEESPAADRLTQTKLESILARAEEI